MTVTAQDALQELRYLVANAESLTGAVRDVDSNLSRISDRAHDDAVSHSHYLSQIADDMWRGNKLLEAILSLQQELLYAAQHPLEIQGSELLQRAIYAHERGFLEQAIGDYTASIRLNWNQPLAYLGLGFATLTRGSNSQDVLVSARAYFEDCVKFGMETHTNAAVTAVQMIVIIFDRLALTAKGMNGSSGGLRPTKIPQK